MCYYVFAIAIKQGLQAVSKMAESLIFDYFPNFLAKDVVIKENWGQFGRGHSGSPVGVGPRIRVSPADTEFTC